MPLEFNYSKEVHEKNKSSLQNTLSKLENEQLIMSALAVLLGDKAKSLGDKLLLAELKNRTGFY